MEQHIFNSLNVGDKIRGTVVGPSTITRIISPGDYKIIVDGEFNECNTCFAENWELMVSDPYQVFRDAEKVGKKIQFRNSPEHKWGIPTNNWSYGCPATCYRIAPEPQVIRLAVLFRDEKCAPLFTLLSLTEVIPYGFQEVIIKQEIKLDL